ncbi:MAG: Fe-S cluster assembly protein SufD [Bernardetiaceae bacterium]
METIQRDTKTTFLAPFEDFEGSLDLGQAREQALERIAELDFPTTRDEEWRYLNLRTLLQVPFQLSNAATDCPRPSQWFDALDVYVMTFVNGYFWPVYSRLPDSSNSLVIKTLQEAVQEQHPLIGQHLNRYTAPNENIFTHLNTAFAQDGLFLHLSKSATLDRPLVVHHLIDAQAEARAILPRHLIVLDDNASGQILEQVTTIGEQPSWSNALTEIVVGRDARLDFHKLQHDSASAYQINQTFVEQADNCSFADNCFSFSGKLIRNNLYLGLGAHNDSYMNGFFLLDGRSIVDNHTAVDHRLPHSRSDEMYKGILDEQSTGVFNGKIFVRQDAQKTNAFQSNANMLLSDQATIDTKPQLEIWADDVRCSHGATTGAMDTEQLFYLRARGIPERQAKGLLLRAFVAEVLERLRWDDLRHELETRIEARLNNA